MRKHTIFSAFGFLTLIFLVIVANCQAQENGPKTSYDSLIIKNSVSDCWVSKGKSDTLYTLRLSDRIFLNLLPGIQAVRLKTGNTGDNLKDYQFGYVDFKWQTVIEARYSKVSDFFRDSLAIVSQPNGQLSSPSLPPYYSWHIKLDNSPLYEQRYYNVFPYSYGYAVAEIDGSHNFGHINKKGELIYKQVYVKTYPFNRKGKAAAIKSVALDKDRTLFVVIDTAGRELISVWSKYQEGNRYFLPKEIEDFINK